MKTFEEKRTILCDMAELYLDTSEKSHIDVNNGKLVSSDVDSINFLLLMALTFPNDGSNEFAQGIDIDQETRENFVDTEFKKIMSLNYDVVKKGKTVLVDAKAYYNSKYNNISYEEIGKIARKLGEDGFHI